MGLLRSGVDAVSPVVLTIAGARAPWSGLPCCVCQRCVRHALRGATLSTLDPSCDFFAAQRSLFHASIRIQSTAVSINSRGNRCRFFFYQSRSLAEQFLAHAHWHQRSRAAAGDRRGCSGGAHHGIVEPMVGRTRRDGAVDGGIVGGQCRFGVLHAVEPARPAVACFGWQYLVCAGGRGLRSPHSRPGPRRGCGRGRIHCFDGAPALLAPARRGHGVVCGADCG